jgi:hypothetical protein
MKILDTQGEVSFAGDIRYFATHLPQARTDRQRIVVDYVLHMQKSKMKDQLKFLVPLSEIESVKQSSLQNATQLSHENIYERA